MRLRSLLSATALLAASLISSSAFASPITGGFSLTSFGGSYVGGTASTATGLDFGNVGGPAGNGYGTNGTALVGNVSGSFLGLAGTTASIADISLGAFANPYTVNPFISFGTSPITISFSNASYSRSPLGTSVTVAGIATFSDGIAADTNTGTFSLAANSQTGDATGVNFTFTSNVATTAVTPEPSSLLLLGTGLIGTASMMLRRRKLVG